ncbi:helix-turn-helix transcriptional regulator [Pedobacter sp.]
MGFLFASFSYQLAVFLCSSGQRWRCWRLLLIGVLLLHNCCSGIFPNVELSVPLSLQYILRYGIGFALGGCFPLYFYKAHGMVEFLFHLRFGVPVCYGLSFLVFFCEVLPLGGELDWVLRWGMLLPSLCTLSLFVVLGIGVYRKLSEREGMHLRMRLDELLLSVISVAPWALVALFVYWKVEPWVRMWWMNVGFLLAWLLMVARDIRQKVVELRLSSHVDLEQQLTFRDRCLGFGLSKREIEVAELLCAGLTYREIAEQLYISLHTVDNHVRHIFAKVEVKRKMELLAKLRPEGKD